MSIVTTSPTSSPKRSPTTYAPTYSPTYSPTYAQLTSRRTLTVPLCCMRRQSGSLRAGIRFDPARRPGNVALTTSGSTLWGWLETPQGFGSASSPNNSTKNTRACKRRTAACESNSSVAAGAGRCLARPVARPRQHRFQLLIASLSQAPTAFRDPRFVE